MVSIPFFHGGNQKVGFLREVERLLHVSLLGRLIGLGEEQAGVLKRLVIGAQEAPMAETIDALLDGTL